MTLTKNQLIESIYEQCADIGYSRKNCVDMVEDLLEIMKQTMERGDDILVSGFGKFCVNEKKARKGRNPSTGEDMLLKRRRVVTFKCSSKLRKKINNK
ncbi:MAG: integration host factor subunit alpha [Desulfobacterales bacterium]|nr:integration host factor subunit alpha [Desulfobacterales bacterium]